MSRRALVLVVLAGIVLAVLPIGRADKPIVQVLTLAFLFAALAQAWNLIGGYGGQISFAHGAFFGVSGYAAGLLISRAGWNPYLALGGGVVAAVLLALVVGSITLRLRGVYFALASFVLTLILQILALHFAAVTGGSDGMQIPLRQPGLATFQARSALPFYYIGMGLMAAYLAVTVALARARVGLYLRAISGDHVVAATYGVDTFRWKMTVLLLSAALSGVVGPVYLHYTLLMDPATAFSADTAVKIVMIAVVGGPGTPLGPILGAVVVPVSEYLTIARIGPSGLGLIIYGLLLVTTVKILPGGLVTLFARRKGAADRHARPVSEPGAAAGTAP